MADVLASLQALQRQVAIASGEAVQARLEATKARDAAEQAEQCARKSKKRMREVVIRHNQVVRAAARDRQRVEALLDTRHSAEEVQADLREYLAGVNEFDDVIQTQLQHLTWKVDALVGRVVRYVPHGEERHSGSDTLEHVAGYVQCASRKLAAQASSAARHAAAQLGQRDGTGAPEFPGPFSLPVVLAAAEKSSTDASD